MSADYRNVPAELRALDQWVCWQYRMRKNNRGEVKRTKVPLTPAGVEASTTDAATWSTFDRCAHAQGHDGIGFVFSEHDPYFGVDFDGMYNPATRQVQQPASGWLVSLDTYAEVTPSGEGVHAIGKGTLPGRGKKPTGMGMEIYDRGRFFTVTGRHLDGTPAAPQYVNGALTDLYAALCKPGLPDADQPAHRQYTSPLSDNELLERARHSAQAAKFAALWSGDTAAYANDQSSADLALCNILAFWCDKDTARMDRLFRQSGLMREKWDSKRGASTYGADTIEMACKGVKESYQPPAPLTLLYGGASGGDGARGTGTDGMPAQPEPVRRQYELTDLGNGTRFADLYAGSLTYARYGANTGDWRAWDGTRWAVTVQDDLLDKAGYMTRQMVISAMGTALTDEAKALLKHAIKSQAEARLNATVNLAKHGLGSWARDYDTNAWLLNCTNGTLDLATGELRAHDPADLISKSTGIAYDPAAPCPIFDAFLAQILPDPDVQQFVQMAAGYSLTGLTREQCLFFCYGTGKNGKSTLLNILKYVLGEYATTTRTDTFMAKKSDGGANSDVADLMGARLVTASEPDEGKRIAESLLKEMTGQDALKARFLYKEFFSFTPAFKLWFMSNHKPTIRGTDEGIWRRIRLIPFTTNLVPEQMDKTLPERLQDEASGILRWMVEGCNLWQDHGLIAPKAVMDATQEYRQDMDILGTFLDECCIVEKGAKTPKPNVYAAYSAWLDRSNEYKVSVTMFSRRMVERGFTEYNNGVVRMWRGLRMKSPQDTNE